MFLDGVDRKGLFFVALFIGLIVGFGLGYTEGVRASNNLLETNCELYVNFTYLTCIPKVLVVEQPPWYENIDVEE